MQQRVEIPVVGIWPALRGKILPLAKKHPNEAENLIKAAGVRVSKVETYLPKRSTEMVRVPDAMVLDDMLKWLAHIAVEPNGETARKCLPPNYLLNCYGTAPELTLGVLKKARVVWFKASKAQHIWRMLAGNQGIKALPHQSAKSVWELTDKELLTAFEGAFTAEEKLTVDDIEKARKRLARDIHAGERLLANW